MSAVLLPMPRPELLARTLSELFGRPVECKPVKPVAQPAGRPFVVASYVDGGGALAAVILSDVAFAASSGAALVMIPADVAAEAAAAGTLEGNLAENFQEVVNVAAGLFNSPVTPRVVLREFKLVRKLEGDVEALAKSPGARIVLEVAIQGYPIGRITVLGRRCAPVGTASVR